MSCPPEGPGDFHSAKQAAIDVFERQFIASAIARAGGNISKAARLAGFNRVTLYRLMAKHSLRASDESVLEAQIADLTARLEALQAKAVTS